MQFTAKVLRVLMCVVLGVVLSGQALAWNDRGHMTVAYLAYKQLTPTARDRVNALLKLNPKYSDWSATVDKEAPGASADDKNLMIFMIAATWADGSSGMRLIHRTAVRVEIGRMAALTREKIPATTIY